MKKENLSKLILIRIDEEYISYLRKYDSKVQINSSVLHKDNKPFVGVLFEINNLKYFVPISSNKKDKLSRMFNKYVETGKKPIDMFFIEETYNDERKLLSVLNLNNMIPVCDRAIINYNISQDKDYFLLRKEIAFCNLHKKKIISDSKRIYNAVITHSWQSLENRCCNFKSLEEKCIYYQSQNI